MNKHSQAPWRIERYRESYNATLKTIYILSADDMIVAKCGMAISPDIEVNSKMMVEAPEMYEAIKEAVEWSETWRYDGTEDEWRQKMKDIIERIEE